MAPENIGIPCERKIRRKSPLHRSECITAVCSPFSIQNRPYGICRIRKKAVALSEEGVTASMVTMNRVSDDPYTIEYGYAEIKNIANEAKSVPTEWINAAGNDVTQELIDYLTPLIQGESNVTYENGLPVYMDVSHLTKHQ